MTLEQCKRRYSAATLATSRARVRYQKLLRKLYVRHHETGEIVNAFRLYIRFDSCLDVLDYASGELFMQVYKRGNKISVAPASEDILARLGSVCKEINERADVETELKFKLHDEFGLSYDDIHSLDRWA